MKKEVLDEILNDFEKIKNTEITLKYELPVTLEVAIHRENLWGKLELTRIMLQPGMTIIPYIITNPAADERPLYVYLEVLGMKLTESTGSLDVKDRAWAKFKCDADLLQHHGYLESKHEL